MEINFTGDHLRISKAYLEFMAVVQSDVESAHGFKISRPRISPAAMALYDRVVEAAEAQSLAEGDADAYGGAE
jgi:hypothetical protein